MTSRVKLRPDTVFIDADTVRNLELVSNTLSNKSTNTLYGEQQVYSGSACSYQVYSIPATRRWVLDCFDPTSSIHLGVGRPS